MALAAAIAVLLAAWFIPLPRLVLSDEEYAAARMPETRDSVRGAQQEFEAAQSGYRGYVVSHDVGADIASFDAAVARLRERPDDTSARSEVVQASVRVESYLEQLAGYAKQGDTYLRTLHLYDDELMAWTRSLGARSESLRPDTWPIVEYLKLYPPPTGLKTGFQPVTAQEAADLYSRLVALRSTGSSPQAPPEVATLNEMAEISLRTREAGRTLEYVQSLHPGYHDLLAQYDVKVQSVISGASAALSAGRSLFAVGADAVVALLLVAGLAALFLPRRSRDAEAEETP